MISKDELLKLPVILDRKCFLLAASRALANVRRQEGWFFSRDEEISVEFLQKITKVFLVFAHHFDEVNESNFEKESILSEALYIPLSLL